MGHYDSSYEAQETEAKKEQDAQRKKAKKLLKEAAAFSDYASESDLFKQKIREAIYWLENDLG
jgi:hypothetical protein